jgi:sugar phosphate permease
VTIEYLNKPLRYRWLIFWILAIGYLFVYLHRVSTAVVAPELLKSFEISGTVLGILASAYFYPYAIMQLPMGLLVDYLGPRKTVTAFLLIACCSTILFGSSPNISMAIFARVLIGFSVAGIFIPTMKILAEWYRLNEFATMAGTLYAIGGLGWLLATTPLALLINWLGWRMAFVLIGIMMLIITILTWTLVQNRPEEMGWPRIADPGAGPTKVRIGLAEGVTVVLSERYFWPLAIRFFCTYGTVIGFGGLWGGPYLMEIYGLTKAEAGNILMMIAVGLIIGSPFLGWLSERVFDARKPVLIGGAFINLLVWVPLAFWTEKLNVPFLYLLTFMIGLFGTGISMVALTAHKELFPKEITGTSIGLINTIPFGGAAIFPPLMGYIMDEVGRVAGAYPVYAYRKAFNLCFILAGIAFLATCFMKETLGKRVEEES